MKNLICGAIVLATLAAPAFALEPIPGSIIYPAQPRTKLIKAPVGSLVTHSFADQFGRRVSEQYRINPDRSLNLVHRNMQGH